MTLACSIHHRCLMSEFGAAGPCTRLGSARLKSQEFRTAQSRARERLGRLAMIQTCVVQTAYNPLLAFVPASSASRPAARSRGPKSLASLQLRADILFWQQEPVEPLRDHMMFAASIVNMHRYRPLDKVRAVACGEILTAPEFARAMPRTHVAHRQRARRQTYCRSSYAKAACMKAALVPEH